MAEMRQVAASMIIVHMLLSMWAPGGIAEFARLPSLQHHYSEHLVESDGAMGWGEFLLLHFADSEHERKDGGRHGALPFHGATMAFHMFLPPAGLPNMIPAPLAPAIKAAREVVEVGEWPSRSVFHPPKLNG